jgi:hypothetical protein
MQSTAWFKPMISTKSKPRNEAPVRLGTESLDRGETHRHCEIRQKFDRDHAPPHSPRHAVPDRRGMAAV